MILGILMTNTSLCYDILSFCELFEFCEDVKTNPYSKYVKQSIDKCLTPKNVMLSMLKVLQ